MYTNEQFTLTSEQHAVDFVRSHPLGVLAITHDGRLHTSPIPLDLRGDADDLFVAGHVARANDMWHDFEHRPPASMTFVGSQAYVPAEWFGVRSRIPTWVYASVEITGRLVPTTPEETRQDVEAFMDRLQRESVAGSTWTLREIPEENTSQWIRGIVGFRVHDLTVKSCFRLNQRKSAEHREALAQALESTGLTPELELAELVRRPPTIAAEALA